jgi:hypothetical protein
LTDLANELAKMLAGAYGRPPESQGGSKPAPPTGSELTDLANELANYADESLVTRSGTPRWIGGQIAGKSGESGARYSPTRMAEPRARLKAYGCGTEHRQPGSR